MKSLLLILFFQTNAMAIEKISLTQFLEEVKQKSPQIRSLYTNVQSLEKRLDEANLPLSPIGYANWTHGVDEKPTSNPGVQGTKTEADAITLGIKKEFIFGLAADLSVDRTNIELTDATLLTDPKYTDSRLSLNLRQSLWRNTFGELTRAQRNATRAAVRAELMQARYQWRNMMIQAENVYWTVASLQQVVRLQQANFESAQKLSSWMSGRQKLNLVDDVESLQTQAASQARELELKSSQDQLNAALQTFQTLRGLNVQTEVELDSLPESEWATQLKELHLTKKHREDFEALRLRAQAEKEQAIATKSSLRPQLDLIGSYSSNGRDVREYKSYREVDDFDQPSWMVGVSFSVPLDFGLANRLKEASRLKQDASQFALEQASFEEIRTWEDIIRKRREAQERYEQAIGLEKIRTNLVERERRRLRNGRTTTFQAITNEQDLATAQVLRVQAQLNLIQTHNQIKAFVEGL